MARWKALWSSPYDATIWALAAPSLLALAADPMLAIVDTAIVGQLGQQQLAALGINNSLFSLCFVVFNFLSVATTPTVAAALSAKDTKRAGETILQALLLALLLGSGVAGALLLQPQQALLAMGIDAADRDLIQLAASFLVIRATAAPAALLVTVSQGVFRGLQDMKTPLAVTVGTNLVHLVLSWYFIFEMKMGLPGAALSTTVAEWLAAITYLQLGWNRREELGLTSVPKGNPFGGLEDYLPFLQAGGAVLMRTAVLLGTKTLASMVATRLGTVSIASHQVLSQVWVLSSLIIDSLAIAGQTMVAVRLGQGERATARQITNRLLELGLMLGLGLAMLMGTAAPWWPHVFTRDKEVLDTVGALLPLAIAMLPVNALVYVLDGVLVGASDFQFLVGAMVLAAGSSAALLLAVEPLDLGFHGVWIAMSALMVGRFSTLMWRFQSNDGPLPPSCEQQLRQLAAPAAAAANGSSKQLQHPPPDASAAAVLRSSSSSGSSMGSTASMDCAEASPHCSGGGHGGNGNGSSSSSYSNGNGSSSSSSSSYSNGNGSSYQHRSGAQPRGFVDGGGDFAAASAHPEFLGGAPSSVTTSCAAAAVLAAAESALQQPDEACAAAAAAAAAVAAASVAAAASSCAEAEASAAEHRGGCGAGGGGQQQGQLVGVEVGPAATMPPGHRH